MEWLDSFWSTYSTLVLSTGTNVLLALSIYITLACGLLSVANAGFMAIGAYSAALLTLHTGTPLTLALILGAIAAAMMALLIGVPTLRLSGVYLAMGKMKLVGNAVDMSRTPPGIERPPPTLGEHTEEILAELGYDNGAIAKLRKNQII